jgi:hypothetical protein
VTDDTIPSCGTYRGIPIDTDQPETRIKKIVEPEIDHIFQLEDPIALDAWAVDPANSPESRRFAAAKVLAILENHVANRTAFPNGVSRERIRAAVAGLDSLMWRSRTHYCSMLSTWGAVEREHPLRDGE